MERRRLVLVRLARVAAAATSAALVAAPATAGPLVTAPGTAPVDDDAVFVYERGVLTPADGSFEVAFSTAPSYVVGDNNVPSLIAWSGTTSEAVQFFPPDALTGEGDGAGADDRARRFVESSGTEIDWLANTATRLGPFPAAYFIARLVLNDDTPAVLYGAVVVRDDDVTVVVFTDRSDDDDGDDGGGDGGGTGRRAREFVESYTAVFEVPPAESDADDDDDVDVTVSFDGEWRVAFPDDGPTMRASSEEGFAYAEYHARAADGDHAYVRVTELPPGYTGEPLDLLSTVPAPNLVDTEVLAGFGAGSDPTADISVTAHDVDGRPATIVTYRPDETRPRTVTALTIVDASGGGTTADRDSTRLITVAYVDVDGDSQNDADEFVESFVFSAAS